jgi:DHA1 family bicyclomycin/chloramphenicol resistance-like MFS transporter
VLFYLWLMSIFVMIGFSIGNLTALAMEPLGHIAGTAASTVNAIATFGSVIFATIIGQQFDKTALPMMVGVFGATLVALICVLELRKLERAPA